MGKQQDAHLDARLSEFEVEFEDKLNKLEDQIKAIKVAADKPGRKMIFTEENGGALSSEKQAQAQPVEVVEDFSMANSKGKPVEVRSAPPKKRIPQ